MSVSFWEPCCEWIIMSAGVCFPIVMLMPSSFSNGSVWAVGCLPKLQQQVCGGLLWQTWLCCFGKYSGKIWELWAGKASIPQSLTSHCEILENKNTESSAENGGLAWEANTIRLTQVMFWKGICGLFSGSWGISMMSMRPEPLKYSLSFNREVDTG